MKEGRGLANGLAGGRACGAEGTAGSCVTEEQQGEVCVGGRSMGREGRVLEAAGRERERQRARILSGSCMLGFYSEIGSHCSVLSRRLTSSDIF